MNDYGYSISWGTGGGKLLEWVSVQAKRPDICDAVRDKEAEMARWNNQQAGLYLAAKRKRKQYTGARRSIARSCGISIEAVPECLIELKCLHINIGRELRNGE